MKPLSNIIHNRICTLYLACDHLPVFALFKVQYNLKMASRPLSGKKTLRYLFLVCTVLTFTV